MRRFVNRHVLPATLPRDEMAQQINAIRPDVVFSPRGSNADQIFRILAERALSVPSSIWVYDGDALSHGGCNLIESFGCPGYSVYQAVEIGRLGFECERRDGFHLNVNLSAERIVDEASRDVRAGTSGEDVVEGSARPPRARPHDLARHALRRRGSRDSAAATTRARARLGRGRHAG
jgi:hypothetical protein